MGDQDGASGHDSGLGLPAFDTTLQEKSSIQTADVDGKSPPYRTPGGSGVATGSEQGGNEGELEARGTATLSSDGKGLTDRESKGGAQARQG